VYQNQGDGTNSLVTTGRTKAKILPDEFVPKVRSWREPNRRKKTNLRGRSRGPKLGTCFPNGNIEQ